MLYSVYIFWKFAYEFSIATDGELCSIIHVKRNTRIMQTRPIDGIIPNPICTAAKPASGGMAVDPTYAVAI